MSEKDEKALSDIMKDLDKNNDGVITFDEFKESINSLIDKFVNEEVNPKVQKKLTQYEKRKTGST